MTAILLALGSGVGYGVSDFLASRVARRVPPVLLVLYSQALQSVVLLVVVVAVRQPYSPGGLAWGTVSGAVGAAGLVAYYQALATGQTAIVAPLASSGAVLPVLVDLARGERPGPLVLAGLVMVLGGIAVTSLAAFEEPDQAAPAPTWHGPPATPGGSPASARPSPSCSPWSRRCCSGCSSSASTRAARPPAGASSGSPSGSSWVPCPPPWPVPCAPGAGAWASTTRPCWPRWRC